MAIELPREVRAELGRAIEALRPRNPGARWIPAENLHCTLAFLGTVEDARVPAVSEAVGAAVAGLVDFPVHLDALGAFPSGRRARVIWAGLADPAGGLTAVAASVGESLEALGFAREARPFRAHVTLARAPVPQAADVEHVLEPLRFQVERATLFESHLGRGPARYEVLATFPFRRELTPPRPD